MSAKLTGSQINYLRFIRDNDVKQSRWVNHDWHELSADGVSVRVADYDHFACRPFIDMGDWNRSLVILNEAGRAALAEVGHE